MFFFFFFFFFFLGGGGCSAMPATMKISSSIVTFCVVVDRC